MSSSEELAHISGMCHTQKVAVVPHCCRLLKAERKSARNFLDHFGGCELRWEGILLNIPGGSRLLRGDEQRRCARDHIDKSCGEPVWSLDQAWLHPDSVRVFDDAILITVPARRAAHTSLSAHVVA
jgi:hypothetical protein